MQTLHLGVTELYVKDPEQMLEFYHTSLGLEIIKQSTNEIELGWNRDVLLRLFVDPDISFAAPNSAGLYHTAIVFSSQSLLARRLKSMLIAMPESYIGSADHIATEAFYFTDPEQNGLEIYFDKPREQWQYDQNGKPIMGSEYIDATDYIELHFKEEPQASEVAKIGHMHLKVGNIEQAREFYVDLLKFEVMADLHHALFVAKDGYHHHLGLNTWQSAGAGMRSERQMGLKSFEIIYEDHEFYLQIKLALDSAGYDFQEQAHTIILKDPWGTTIYLKSQIPV